MKESMKPSKIDGDINDNFFACCSGYGIHREYCKRTARPINQAPREWWLSPKPLGEGWERDGWTLDPRDHAAHAHRLNKGIHVREVMPGAPADLAPGVEWCLERLSKQASVTGASLPVLPLDWAAWLRDEAVKAGLLPNERNET